jgi:thioester reductase-like protein
MSRYLLWQPGVADKVVAVSGDLEKPLFGLSSAEFCSLAGHVSCVYHCGALVNHVLPYSVLRPANILGTVEALRFATTGGLKRVNYVSTISALLEPASGLEKVRHTDSAHTAVPSAYTWTRPAASPAI